jgi:hypothetical protein
VGKCDAGSVNPKKPTASQGLDNSTGMKMVEEYRPRMSRLTSDQRLKLMMRGLQTLGLESILPRGFSHR